MTPLMYAAKRGNLEVVKTLIENKHADVNIKEHASVQSIFATLIIACAPTTFRYSSGQPFSLRWKPSKMMFWNTFLGVRGWMYHN